MISVLMPAYNAEKYIVEAIESILNQTYKDFEFIIVNDGSRDNTAQIIKRFQDPRIVFINRQENKGIVYSLNEGLKLAKGEYIARMDADDISLPDRFAKQIEYLNNHPDVGVCGGSYLFIGKNTGWNAPIDVYEQMMYHCVVAHPTVMMRKQVMYTKELYDIDYQYAEDYELWCRLLRRGVKIANIQDVILHYRLSNTHISSTHVIEQTFKKNVIILNNLCANKEINIDDKKALKNIEYIYMSLRKLKKIKDLNVHEKKIFDDLCYIFSRYEDDKLKRMYYYYLVAPKKIKNLYRMIKIILN